MSITITVTFPLDVYSRQRIRNRWLVAYTLVRNPSLQRLTARNLAISASEEGKSEGEELIEDYGGDLVQVLRKRAL